MNLKASVIDHPKFRDAREGLLSHLTQLDSTLTLLVGPVGVGKTLLLNQVEDDLKHKSRTCSARLPVVNVSATPSAEGKSFLKMFLVKLLGVVAPGLQGNLKSATTARCRIELENIFKSSATRVVLIDDAHVWFHRLQQYERELLGLLSLSRELNCHFALAGTEELVKRISSAGPVIRRLNSVSFDGYSNSEADVAAFQSVLTTILARLANCNILFREADLQEGSRGRVGLLMAWIDRAQRHATLRKSTVLEWTDFEEARLRLPVALAGDHGN